MKRGPKTERGLVLYLVRSSEKTWNRDAERQAPRIACHAVWLCDCDVHARVYICAAEVPSAALLKAFVR